MGIFRTMIEVGTMILFLIAFSAMLFFLFGQPLLQPLSCVELVGFLVGILLIARLQQSARDWESFTLAKNVYQCSKIETIEGK